MKIATLSQIKGNNGLKFDFKDVIESIDGHKVVKFNNPELLKKLKIAANNTKNRNNSRKNPYEGRINEFGNYVQKLFAEECKKLGLNYSTPKDVDGKQKESGYPDGCIQTDDGYFCYIEIKTFAEKNKETSLRSFFYSPSKTSKNP